MSLAAGLLCASVAGASAALGPRLLARLPEPPPAEDDDRYPPKIPYADLAVRPHLGPRLAVVAALAAGGLGLVRGWSVWLVLGVTLSAAGALLAYVDLRTWLLPTRLLAPAYAVAVAVLALTPLTGGTLGDVGRAVIGWGLAATLLGGLWWTGAGLGYGDVRLGTLLALSLGLLGWGPWAVGLWSGFTLGALGWLPLRGLGLTVDRRLPFGPFLLAGAWLGAMVGGPVWAALTG